MDDDESAFLGGMVRGIMQLIEHSVDVHSAGGGKKGFN